jgi:hypothetical protein
MACWASRRCIFVRWWRRLGLEIRDVVRVPKDLSTGMRDLDFVGTARRRHRTPPISEYHMVPFDIVAPDLVHPCPVAASRVVWTRLDSGLADGVDSYRIRYIIGHLERRPAQTITPRLVALLVIALNLLKELRPQRTPC